MQTEDAENIGYVIPVDVVNHFITDFERNNRFTSFPILGVDWQKMESPYLRAALGMKVLSLSTLRDLSESWPCDRKLCTSRMREGDNQGLACRRNRKVSSSKL